MPKITKVSYVVTFTGEAPTAKQVADRFGDYGAVVKPHGRKPKPPAPTERDHAKTWLKRYLRTRERPAGDVHHEAEARGFSYNTLRRAADDLGVIRTNGRGSVWRLSDPGAK